MAENNKSNTKKTNKKKTDKSFVIIICLCIALAVGIVGFIVLPEPIIGAIELHKAQKFLGSADIVSVVINAPMESGGILADAEKVLSKKEASDFAERFSNILKNVKYSDTEAINTGIWKIKAVFYNSTDEMRIYVDEARIYLERNGKLITYDVPDSVKNDYDALYSEINELLES